MFAEHEPHQIEQHVVADRMHVKRAQIPYAAPPVRGERHRIALVIPNRVAERGNQ